MIAYNEPENYKSRGELIADNMRLAGFVKSAEVLLGAVVEWHGVLSGRWWYRLIPKRARLAVELLVEKIRAGVVE